MRVATASIYNQGVFNLNNRQVDLFKLQNQLSTGRAILTPSDNPVASARALDLQQSVSINEQYIENNKYANDTLALTESNLQGIISSIQDIQQLAIQSGNPALTAAEKRMIEADIRGKYQQLLGIANTTDGNGLYIFSGYRGDTKPFNEVTYGNVRYDGDQGTRAVQISPSRQIPVSNSGTDVFVNIKTGNGTFATSLGRPALPRTVQLADGGPIQFQRDPAGGYVASDYKVDWNGTNYTITRVSDGATSVQTHAALTAGVNVFGMILQAQGNQPLAGTATAGFDGKNINNGGTGVISAGVVSDPLKWANANNTERYRVQFHSVPDPTSPGKLITSYDIIDNQPILADGVTANTNYNRSLIDGYNYTTGLPAGGRTDTTATPNAFPRVYTPGAEILFSQEAGETGLYAGWDFGAKFTVDGVPKDGDSFAIEPSVDKDLFSTLGDFSSALTSYANNEVGGATFQNHLNMALANLDNTLSRVLTVQASIGSRQKEGASTQDTNEDLNVQSKATISKLTDLDFTKAISEFTQTQTYLDAARQSFASVQNLSLFKYIGG